MAINPANKVELLPLPRDAGLEGAVLTPYHLALLTSKYWGSGGIKLTVGFLDNPDQATRTLILQHMNAWAPRANVAFTASASQTANVRITRTQGQGYYSYLGTDILYIPAGEPTMNLEAFTASTPLSEYKRVVRHETGHTLGFPHEHTRRELVARIDPVKAKAYFLAADGWDAKTVQEQVLTPLNDADLTFITGADQLSIMCYELPGSITIDGQPIPGGTDIDETDYLLAAKLYPPSGGPVSPPGPPPPPQPSGVLYSFTINRDVPGGRLWIPVKAYMAQGVYDVSHHTGVGSEPIAS